MLKCVGREGRKGRGEGGGGEKEKGRKGHRKLGPLL